MEFVPYEFCDSVVFLSNPKKLAEIEKLAGYWSKAARKPTNRTDIRLTVVPADADHWECLLRDCNSIRTIKNWDEHIAANHCLVLNAVTVLPGDSYGTYKTLSTAELMKLLLYCNKKPFEWEFQAAFYKMTDQQWTRTLNLFENFDICRIQLDYEPGCRQFLVKRLRSQHLVGIHIRYDIPSSLHSEIKEWARRVEFDELYIETEKLQFEFSVFEKLLRRIEGGHARFLPYRRKRLNMHCSGTDCEKIWSYLGTSGLISTYEAQPNEFSRRWKREKVSVRVYNARARHRGSVLFYHEDVEDA